MVDSVVGHKALQFKATFFVGWITRWPASGGGVVISEAVVIKSRLPIAELGGEQERVDLGHRAGGADEFAEGAVLVVGGNGAVGCVHQGHDVAVAVVAIEVGPGVGPGWHRHGNQSPDPARTLGASAQIRAPHK